MTIGIILLATSMTLSLFGIIAATTTVLRFGSDKEQIAIAFRKQRYWWLIGAMLAFAQSATGLGIEVFYRNSVTQTVPNALVTLNQSPDFACNQVAHIGNGWMISGPVKIAGSLFRNFYIAGPHLVNINGTDVWQYIEDNCDRRLH